ncbi:hypothetical protein [Halomonas sp. PR-M31]|uniref:hypothetical protein n=1 Tax=Halomonas sp. PR-M31 TaxID=1471202 RepID=UPI0006512D26|nr:hypothetical protein [Halomonas sp. PR-M31]
MNRSDEPRMTTPIVPEPDNETVPRHRSSSRPDNRGKTRALWFLCLILLAALVSMGVYYWFDRQEWQTKQRELDGQLSNLHARFDSLDDRQQGTGFKAQLNELSSNQQSLNDRQQELATLLKTLQERAAKIDPEATAKRLETARKERDTLSATLDAMGRSLTTLEQSGEKARAALDTRLKDAGATRDDLEQRLQAMNGTITELEDQIQSFAGQDLDKTLATVQERMDSTASRIEALEEASQQQRARFDELDAAIQSNRASLTELRQGQLVLSASVENLSDRLE